MPFPSNWLEELVAEWLDLDDFLVGLKPPIQIPNGRGGRLAPDVVGGRCRDNIFEVRHCEAVTWLNVAPEKVSLRYQAKFSQNVMREVEREFRQRLGIPVGTPCRYERWIVFAGATQTVIRRLIQDLPGVRLIKVDEFIREHALAAAESWRNPRLTTKGNPPSLPDDKWLVTMLDFLRFLRMI